MKFEYGGHTYEADTPEEGIRFLALLEKRDEERDKDQADKRVWKQAAAAWSPGSYDAMTDNLHEMFGTAPWTPALFHSFVERLGGPQIEVLTRLLVGTRLQDEELRAALGIDSNQALAGILSGISKQAAAVSVSARDVFTLENLRSRGKRRSTYAVADKFKRMASEMNWPSA